MINLHDSSSSLLEPIENGLQNTTIMKITSRRVLEES